MPMSEQEQKLEEFKKNYKLTEADEKDNYENYFKEMSKETAEPFGYHLNYEKNQDGIKISLADMLPKGE